MQIVWRISPRLIVLTVYGLCPFICSLRLKMFQSLARMSGMLDLSNDANAKHFLPRWWLNVANVEVLPVSMLPIAISASALFLYRQRGTNLDATSREPYNSVLQLYHAATPIENWNWLLATFPHWQHSLFRFLSCIASSISLKRSSLRS